MESKSHFYNLRRSGLRLSIVIGVYVFVTSYMETESLMDAAGKMVFVLLSFLMMSFCDMKIIRFLEHSTLNNPSAKVSCRYAASSLAGIIIIFFVKAIYSYLIAFGLIISMKGKNITGAALYIYLPLQAMLMNAVVMVWHNYLIAQNAKVQIELENSRLNTVSAEAAYQLLRQQIHPHFLFNALSTLKSLIRKYPDLAEDYLVRLSDFLRASISSGGRRAVPLTIELKLCNDYLEMQKIRLGNALQVHLDLPEAEQEYRLLPVFSLQPLLENAIKHNELTEEFPLHIKIFIREEWITVENNIRMKHIDEQSTGSGLASLAERYKLLSGDDIVIRNNGAHFSVSLKTLQDEDRNHRG